jgi:hypothetical protein
MQTAATTTIKTTAIVTGSLTEGDRALVQTSDKIITSITVAPRKRAIVSGFFSHHGMFAIMFFVAEVNHDVILSW